MIGIDPVVPKNFLCPFLKTSNNIQSKFIVTIGIY